MLTGLLFGQDVLILKSGESFEGAFYGKVGEDIVFKIEGETSTKKFPIWSVETIVTKNGELTYPFDIPTKELSKPDLLLLKSGNFYKGVFIDKVDKNIIFNIEGDSIHTEISIYNVDIIKTDNGEYYYPFDTPTKKVLSKNIASRTFDSNYQLDSNYKHYFNFFGVPNHRTGIGMFGYSITKRTKKNNEYYMGIGTIIINLSITAGWKYYFKKSNADDYYLAMSLVGSTLEIDDRYDETKKVSKDFIAGNFSAGYEKRLSKNMYLNMEIFTLIGIMPNSEGITDGIRYLVAPSFHFNYRI
jgi:hypothetical protein